MTIYVCSGTAAGADALSLRRDYGLNPSMTASALGTAINDAIQSAISAGRSLSLGWEAWPVDVPVLIDGPLSLRGDGVYERWTGPYDGSTWAAGVPTTDPFLQGAVIVQTAAGADAIQVTANGESVHLDDFAVRFDGAHRFINTGHGINAQPPVLGSGFDHGVMRSRWRGIKVYGHDGGHYGFRTVNSMYQRLDHLSSYGGGSFEIVNATDLTLYGNLLASDLYGVVFIGGSAHGLYLNSHSGGNDWDYSLFERLQIWTFGAVAAGGAQPAGTTAVTSAQRNVTYNPAGGYNNITFIGLDLETNVGSSASFPPGLGNKYDLDVGGVSLNGATLTNSPTSGTAFRNTTGCPVMYNAAFTMNPTGAAAATVKIECARDSGMTDSLFTVGEATVPISGPTGIEIPVSFEVPSYWYARFTWAHASLSACSHYRTYG